MRCLDGLDLLWIEGCVEDHKGCGGGASFILLGWWTLAEAAAAKSFASAASSLWEADANVFLDWPSTLILDKSSPCRVGVRKAARGGKAAATRDVGHRAADHNPLKELLCQRLAHLRVHTSVNATNHLHLTAL